ncbi:spore protease YyaC [Brevibacillus laterosporus]|uniref:spore protease YyaC n=1 Tax=Brevibacillus laterosporus TaxID=1465 RepID=UPI00215BE64B|nr:spore protease YyaC [Brevibacillus laterosporus]MCR8939796.1 spore protease YyaC [Brevibacillus laterosporus]MCZ0842436.1 spore protease YyaC [Brevibacillus laterosporus]MCZ0846433.1 spore protease YyaC [Brevibacillus laterosporus]
MCLENQIKEILPLDKKVLFVCIGTDRSTGDALGPLIGTKLSKRGYEVLGTLEEPVHALNIKGTLNLINTQYPDHFVIAIDAALGQISSIRKIKVVEGPLKPGQGVGKELPVIGHAHIHGIVNVSGFMEYHILQNTRLSVVMSMADQITKAIVKSFKPKRKKQKRPCGATQSLHFLH